MEIGEDNYPFVRAYIAALDLPERASLTEALDRRFGEREVTADE
jgi:hypothetical protein